MCADITASGLSILAACIVYTADVKLWFMQNGLQLNPDKSEAQYSSWEQSTSYTGSASSLSSVKVAGFDLPVGYITEDIKVLGVVLDRRLTFDKQ